MANRLRDVGKEAFWRDVLRRYERSGESVRAFCRQEGLAEPNFYAWRRTIAQRGARKPAAKVKRKKAVASEAVPAFVPIVPSGAFSDRADIVLELGGGRQLRFDGETSPERLASIVRALESEAAA